MNVIEWIATPLYTGQDELGEGIIWSQRQQCLYWVDVPACAVRRHVPGQEGVSTWLAPDMPTALGECPDGRLLVVGRKAAWLLDPETGRFSDFRDIESDLPHNRSNDGRVGPDGRFWFGTMADNFQPETIESIERRRTGVLYSLDGSGRLTAHWSGLGGPNSIAFDPGRNRMYVGDSWERTIYSVPMPDTGPIARMETFFAPDLLGTNDGSTLDREGTTWNARWGAGCVAGVTHRGKLGHLVRLANSRPSCCIFGGRDLKTLFITTAAPQQSGEVGGLFRVDLPVAGQTPWLFDLAHATSSLQTRESADHG